MKKEQQSWMSPIDITKEVEPDRLRVGVRVFITQRHLERENKATEIVVGDGGESESCA